MNLSAGWRHFPDKDQEQAKSFFTVIRRNGKDLQNVPYSEEYKDDLTKVSNLLREAAELTDNQSLKNFLTTRADAFLSNNYYDSDMAWMDLDAPLDITIGPYETYNDELFGYKAAFEAYINLRDDEESTKLSAFTAAFAGDRKQSSHRSAIPQSQAGRGGSDPRR